MRPVKLAVQAQVVTFRFTMLHTVIKGEGRALTITSDSGDSGQRTIITIINNDMTSIVKLV